MIDPADLELRCECRSYELGWILWSFVKPSVEARIRELKATGMGMLKIGREVGVGTSVVQRVVQQMAE